MNLLRRRFNHIMIFLISILCLLLSGFALNAFSQSTGTKQQIAISEEEGEWSEDLDDKIDKTMQVLSVIKEEIKDYKESEKAKAEEREKLGAEAEKEESLADRLRGKIRRAVRIWKKLRKVVKTEVEAAREEAAGTQEEPDWAQDLSGKLDQTIETMTVIKEELKEAEK